MADPVSEARALLVAATPGPWRVGDPDTLNPRVDASEWSICHVYDADERPYAPDDESVPLDPTPLADAALIAAAPDLLARLCDEVERLRVPPTDLASTVEAALRRAAAQHFGADVPPPDWMVAAVVEAWCAHAANA